MRKLLPWLIGLLWALYTFGPLLSTMIAGAIANAHGCQLDEGSIHPCIVAGKDIGETLYSMGVMAWLMLITLPTGLIAGVVILVVFIVLRVRRRAAS